MYDSDGIELTSLLVRFKHPEFPPKLSRLHRSFSEGTQRRHTVNVEVNRRVL